MNKISYYINEKLIKIYYNKIFSYLYYYFIIFNNFNI